MEDKIIIRVQWFNPYSKCWEDCTPIKNFKNIVYDSESKALAFAKGLKTRWSKKDAPLNKAKIRVIKTIISKKAFLVKTF